MSSTRTGLHPESCTDPDCTLLYVEHLRSVSISAAATPTRRPDTVRIDRTEQQWAKNHAAYRRIHKDIPGLRIDDASRVEAEL